MDDRTRQNRARTGMGAAGVVLDIGKLLSFILSILSLYAVLESAFFIPGSDWLERLNLSLLRIAIAACVCFASGIHTASADVLLDHGRGCDPGRGLVVSRGLLRAFAVAQSATGITEPQFPQKLLLHTYPIPLYIYSSAVSAQRTAPLLCSQRESHHENPTPERNSRSADRQSCD